MKNEKLADKPVLNMNPEHRSRLRDILKAKSYKEGTFVLASGKTSDFYIDCRPSALDAEGSYLIGKLFYQMLEQLSFEVKGVGGMTLGADPLSTATSLISFIESNPLPAFIVRKEAKGHGTKQWMEGRSNFEEGDTVVILEDVVTTGGSSIKAIERVRESGLKIGAVFALVDRLEGGREAIEKEGLPLHCLFDRTDFVS